jgi:Ankyrin repeats (3 copies)/Ankyrin repeats (many copies)
MFAFVDSASRQQKDEMRDACERDDPDWLTAGRLAQTHGPSVTNLLIRAATSEALTLTPLHLASYCGKPAYTRLLLARGADLDARDWSSRTPLHVAVSERQVECVYALIQAGADPDVVDEHGIGAIHHACAGGNMAIVLLLWASGVKLCIVDEYDLRPVHYAIAHGHIHVVSWLVRMGGCAGIGANYSERDALLSDQASLNRANVGDVGMEGMEDPGETAAAADESTDNSNASNLFAVDLMDDVANANVYAGAVGNTPGQGYDQGHVPGGDQGSEGGDTSDTEQSDGHAGGQENGSGNGVPQHLGTQLPNAASAFPPLVAELSNGNGHGWNIGGGWVDAGGTEVGGGAGNGWPHEVWHPGISGEVGLGVGPATETLELTIFAERSLQPAVAALLRGLRL